MIRGSENPWIVIHDSGIEKAAGTNFFITSGKIELVPTAGNSRNLISQQKQDVKGGFARRNLRS